MSYIRTSTANPLGKRPFNSRIPTSPPGMPTGFNLTPPNAPTFSQSAFDPSAPVNPMGPGANPTLKGYYRASFFEPDANSVLSSPPGVPSVLGDYFPNYPSLRPTSHQTRDNIFSPVPRIYLPPEIIPVPGIDSAMGSLGTDRGALMLPARHSNRTAIAHQTARAVAARNAHATAGTYPEITASRPPQPPRFIPAGARPPASETSFQAHRRRRKFSGGSFVPSAAHPRGIFFPATPDVPNQFAAASSPHVYAPNPANPTGYYYPRTPTRVPIPASLRVVDKSWREMTGYGLGAPISFTRSPGAVTPQPIVRTPILPAPIVTQPIAVTPQPVRGPVMPISPGGNLPHPRGGMSPGGHYIPGSGPTYPEGAIPVGSGACQYTSSPESGGVVSVVPCDTLPGYSAGSPGSWQPGGQPGGGGWWQRRPQPWPSQGGKAPWISSSSSSAAPQQTAAYQIALAAAQNGTLTQSMLTGLTAAQQNAALAASQTSTAAQQAALTAGGAGAAVPASTDGSTPAAPVGDTQSLLDWLSQSTLISGFPNWGVAAVGGFGALWLMNRGKK